MGVAVAVLAAGHGTRFNSSLPKHLHPVGGVPIVERVIRAGLAISPDRLVAVVSPALDDLPSRLGMDGQFDVAVQQEPKGTADAVRHALAEIGDCDWLVSLLGDNPLLDGDMVGRLVRRAQETGALVTVLTAEVDDAQEYGRIDCDAQGRALRIVEFSEQDKPNRAHPPIEINSGIMVLNARWARSAFDQLRPNPPKNEYYLTDLVAVAASGHQDGGPWPVEREVVEPEVAVGVNDRIQQANADAIVRDKTRARLM
ncbi:MAG TPA: NTP transferase domain-containing protein, partial [Thermomicrobiales bacterium]|nr:NTP transferase domain-containing protein [Thermomicrobiales bacterium]